MKKNTVLEKLRAGKPSVGTWLGLCSPLAAEYMAHTGFDWLVVDTEHAPWDIGLTIQAFAGICTTPTIPMARVAWNDPCLMKRLLDGGAMGLVIPMVNSVEEAEAAVDAMRFPPVGSRSMGGGRGATCYGPNYPQEANQEIACIVQIEHIKAVENVEAILSVKGVDACFIGPADLASSMQLKPGDKAHEEAIQETLRGAKAVGVPAGIHCMNAEAVNMRVDQGFQFVACASESGFMQAYARGQVAAIKSL